MLSDKDWPTVINKKSNAGPDAVLGTGVYLTKMHPREGKEAIGINNWGDRFKPEKLDYVFAIRIPPSENPKKGDGMTSLFRIFKY